jgi:hypothetical protein
VLNHGFVWLLQDHFGRAEGYNIVHADEQFFAPTDGKPLRGLIQARVLHLGAGQGQWAKNGTRVSQLFRALGSSAACTSPSPHFTSLLLVSGLQDHIVGGTLMTMKDTFFTQSEYSRLIYECIAQDCSGSWEIWMEEPTVLKPQKLWTGKQVVCMGRGEACLRVGSRGSSSGERRAAPCCPAVAVPA